MDRVNFNFQPYKVNIFEGDHLINPLSEKLTKKQRVTCLVGTIALGVLTLGIAQLVVYLKNGGALFPKAYKVNIFRGDHLLHPHSKKLTKKQRVTCLVASIAIGVLTLGGVHLYLYFKKPKDHAGESKEAHLQRELQEAGFRPVKKSNTDTDKVVHVRPPAQWKTYPNPAIAPEFEYEKPRVAASFIHDKEKGQQVKELCKSKMREAMKALEPSMVDAVRSLVERGELSEPVATLDNFCNRIMDLYEAYVEVQIDNNTPMLSPDVGVIKSSGFTHTEILNLQAPCRWYVGKVREFHQRLYREGLTEKEAHIVTEFLAYNKYNYDVDALLADHLSTTEQAFKVLLEEHPDLANTIEEKSKNFCKELNLKRNKSNFNKIKGLDQRITFARSLSQKEKEEMKFEIAENAMRSSLQNPRGRLIEEIRHRFDWRDFEPGFVGSPLRLLNIVRGKHDDETDDAHFRTKLFFIYGSKNILNEVARSSEMVEQINAKLREKGKDWQLDAELTAIQRGHSNTDPVYKLGAYARVNNKGKGLRRWATHGEVNLNKREDPNPTFEEAENNARKGNLSGLNGKFRFPLYPVEEMALWGTNSSLERQELERRRAFLSESKENFYATRESEPDSGYSRVEDYGEADDLGYGGGEYCCAAERFKKPDTSFKENILECQKKNTTIPWVAGKHFFKLYDNTAVSSPYLDYIEALGLPQYAGISGSSDQTFTMAGVVGVNSLEELMGLRLLYIPWMGANHDHTADEIMISVKAFGLPYTPSADYYKQLYPDLEETLTAEIQKEQRRRGYELPDYYLSEEYAREVYTALEGEREQQQDEKIQGLMASHQLFLHGCRTYRANYSMGDLFGDKKWKRYTDFLTDGKINSVNEERRRKREGNHTCSSRYDLNFQERVYQPHTLENPFFYKGTHKQSLTLVPPQGKVTPYVPFDWPHLNRVGLLFDGHESQCKMDKFVFRSDANVDIEQKWKRTYSRSEMESEDFEERLRGDAEEAIRFNREQSHQVSIEELIAVNEQNQEHFVPYNEINGSIHNKGIVGVFTFSRGLPKYVDRKVSYQDQREKYSWPPLHHESLVEHEPDIDYDRYMILMGIGKKLATREKFGIDVPLYQINETTDTGLSLIPKSEQIALLEAMLRDEGGELDGVVRMIKHQSNISDSDAKVKRKLRLTLQSYLIAL